MFSGLAAYENVDKALALGPEPVAKGPALGRPLGTIVAADRVSKMHFIDNDTLLLAAVNYQPRRWTISRWHVVKHAGAPEQPLEWANQWSTPIGYPAILSSTRSIFATSSGFSILDNATGAISTTFDLSSAINPAGSGRRLLAVSPDQKVAAVLVGKFGGSVIADALTGSITSEPFPRSKSTTYSPYHCVADALCSTAFLQAISFDPRRPVIALGFADDVMFWDVGNHRQIRHVPLDFRDVSQISFSPDGQIMAIAGVARPDDSGRIIRRAAVLRTSDDAVIKDIRVAGRLEPTTDDPLAFSADGRLMLFRSWNVVEIFDTASFAAVGSLHNGNRHGLSAIAISPDGSRIAAAVASQVYVFQVLTPARSTAKRQNE